MAKCLKYAVKALLCMVQDLYHIQISPWSTDSPSKLWHPKNLANIKSFKTACWLMWQKQLFCGLIFKNTSKFQEKFSLKGHFNQILGVGLSKSTTAFHRWVSSVLILKYSLSSWLMPMFTAVIHIAFHWASHYWLIILLVTHPATNMRQLPLASFKGFVIDFSYIVIKLLKYRWERLKKLCKWY